MREMVLPAFIADVLATAPERCAKRRHRLLPRGFGAALARQAAAEAARMQMNLPQTGGLSVRP